ncbi:MAG: 30S ribosome-binding factor RbfA [Clostridia bacterium]|nr:30S ribosome-binding factor RbfA [Clostridia bacterium]
MKENRLQRLNSEIKKALADILSNEIRDPRLSGLVSVLDVDTTNDLSHCFISVSIYEQDKKVVERSFNTLQHSANFIRKMLAGRVDLRIVPYLHFKLDNRFEINQKMSKLIDSIDIPPMENSDEQ